MPPRTTITPYKDGPYLLRGEFSLRDQAGGEIGSPRRVIALCRCGKSQIRPFCDGTHRLVGFRAPGGAEHSLSVPEQARAGGEHDGAVL